MAVSYENLFICTNTSFVSVSIFIFRCVFCMRIFRFCCCTCCLYRPLWFIFLFPHGYPFVGNIFRALKGSFNIHADEGVKSNSRRQGVPLFIWRCWNLFVDSKINIIFDFVAMILIVIYSDTCLRNVKIIYDNSKHLNLRWLKIFLIR